MKSSEFKKILKPLIKQTIKEVLLEEGVLSKIVSEVAQGLQYGALMEKKQRAPRQEEILEKQRQERIRRLNESTNLNSDIFAGTAPAPADVESNSYSPMANISPGDSGIDITDIQKLANGKWKTLIGG